jgi:hypothetical protein
MDDVFEEPLPPATTAAFNANMTKPIDRFTTPTAEETDSINWFHFLVVLALAVTAILVLLYYRRKRLRNSRHYRMEDGSTTLINDAFTSDTDTNQYDWEHE